MAIEKIVKINAEVNFAEVNVKGEQLKNTISSITKEMESLTKGSELYNQASNRLENAKSKLDAVEQSVTNVKKILAVKVPNSGGGGGGGAISGVSAPTVPSFNIVGQNSNNQLARSISNQQQQPVEAYVVSGNVTNAQSLDRHRAQTATFN